MNISITVDVACGTDIKTACEEAVSVATKLGIGVNFEFNDIFVFTFPHTNIQSLVLAYQETQKNNQKFVSTLDKE